MSRSMIIGLLGVAFVLLPATVAAAAEGAADGRAIYNFRCYFCHGYSGDAKTLAAEMLVPRPRDFTSSPPGSLSRERMLAVVRDGIDGTAMKPFASLLREEEIEAVVDFVRSEFMERGALNTRYHTVENGWPAHARFAAAFPFVRGEIPLNVDGDSLTPAQRAGRDLFLSTCITCHDIPGGNDAGTTWESEAVSFPRTGFATGDFLDPPDAYSGATNFAIHDVPPGIQGLGPEEKRGEALYQANCAFCHAADGTGQNWIGTFMIPHPRNLTSAEEMGHMTRERLEDVIRNGIPGTSMPAWGAVLSDAQVHDIARYIARAFYPPLAAD